MPTIKIPGCPFRFFFYSNEGNEPAHVHVSHNGKSAKLWLSPVVIADNHGFSGHEINKFYKLTVQHESTILAAWKKHFGR